MNRLFRVTSSLLLALVLMTACCLHAQEKTLSFRSAIELALKNSPTTGSSSADVDRARAVYSQTRDAYLPQMTLGSGLAFSYGFPLSLEGSAPSVFNVNIQE